MSPLKKSGFITLAIFSMFFAACGGDSTSNKQRDGNNNNQPVVSLSMASSVKAYVGESKTIPVTVQGNTSFTVYVDKSGSGCVKSGNNIVCTPTVSGNYTVTATATADAAKKVSASLTVPELEIITGNGQTLYADDTESSIITFNAAGNWTATASDKDGDIPAWLSLDIVSSLYVDDSDIRLYEDESTRLYGGEEYGDAEVSVNAVSVSGGAGNNFISVTLMPNDSMADRTATITITTSTGHITITITQRCTKRDGTSLIPEDVSISISQVTASTVVGTSRIFTITRANTADFTLSAPSAAGCAKSGLNAVICTPTAAGTYTVTVTATADATKSASATLTANAPEPEYRTVTFNVDGSVYATRQTQNGTSLGANMPANPTKSGYTFAGWGLSQSAAVADFYPTTSVTANITIYAIWQTVIINSCAVHFNIDGGITTVNVPCGSSLGANMPANPTKDGHDFVGWNTNSSATTGNFTSTTPVTANITLYAIWKLPRYVATPVAYKADETSGTQNWRLDYVLPVTNYDTWTDYDAYFIYLGKVDFVPIASNTAKYYNGITPIELTYSTTQTTESSVTESITNAISRTTQKVNTWDNVFSVEGKFGYEGIFYSASIKIGYQHNWGGSSSNTEEISRTETYATFSSWAQSNTETVRFTIGANNEVPGFYRYALMATCDVYVTVVHDLDADDWAYEFSMFARPDSLFEAIDYSDTNSFGVGLNAEVLKFDTDVINELLGLERPEKSWVTVYNDDNTDTIISTCFSNPSGFCFAYPSTTVNIATELERFVPSNANSVRITFQLNRFGTANLAQETVILNNSGVIFPSLPTPYNYTFYYGNLTITDGVSSLSYIKINKIEFLQ